MSYVAATNPLERKTISVSRAADFLEQRALVSQTGQPVRRFGEVVFKELLDNALDGAVASVTVADNGNGIPRMW